MRAGDSNCLVTIEYCVLSVLKAKFLQLAARAEMGEGTRGYKCTIKPATHMAFWAQRLHFGPPGAAGQLLAG